MLPVSDLMRCRNVKISFLHNFLQQVELLCVNNDVKPITARMMQEYEFSKEETFSTTASTLIGPSEQVLRNIIDFARCYQNVECGNVQVRFFLN